MYILRTTLQEIPSAFRHLTKFEIVSASRFLNLHLSTSQKPENIYVRPSISALVLNPPIVSILIRPAKYV